MDKERIKNVIAQMSIEEKAALTGGGLVTAQIKRLKVDSVKLPRELNPYADAPFNQLALGCTFNTELACEIGRLRSIAAANNNEAFGGVVSGAVTRDPFGFFAQFGFGEDPIFVAEMLKAFLEKGILPPLVSNILGDGIFLDRYLDKRALMELYFYPFKTVAKKCGGVILPSGALNGTLISENKWFIERVEEYLDEYAFIANEYASVFNKALAASLGGYELFMNDFEQDVLIHSVKNGLIFEKKLNKQLERVLNAVVENNEFNKKKALLNLKVADIDEALKEVERQSLTLLKNDGILPLVSLDGVAVIGDVNDALQLLSLELIKEGAIYSKGYSLNKKPNVKLERNAVKACERKGIAILIVSDDLVEKANQKRLVAELEEAGVKIIAVVVSDSYTDISYLKNAHAIIYLPLIPYNDTSVLKDVLIGALEPSGRLPMTWAEHKEEYPKYKMDKCAARDMYCYESVYNGYRYYEKFNGKVMFPFGHGLSYTKFEFTNFTAAFDGNNLVVEFVVKNIGNLSGCVIPQIYINYNSDRVYGLDKRLVAFTKLRLDKTENKAVKFVIDTEKLEVYDTDENRYTVMGGKYDVMLGYSSENILQKLSVKSPFPARINTGLSAAEAAGYYKSGEFSPLAPEIERVVGAPIMMRESPTYKYCYRDKTDPKTVKFLKICKKAAKNCDKEIIARYVEETAVAAIKKMRGE